MGPLLVRPVPRGRNSILPILKGFFSPTLSWAVMAPGDQPPDPDLDEPFVVPIEEDFDLHSFRPADVLPVVDAYLDEAIARGFREGWPRAPRKPPQAGALNQG